MTKFKISLRALAALLPITAQTDQSAEQLRYLRLEVSHTHYRLVACDNLILALYREAIGDAEPVVCHLRQNQVAALLALLPHDEDGKISFSNEDACRTAECTITKDRIRFVGSFGDISVKLQETAYPNYCKVIPTQTQGAGVNRVRFSYAGDVVKRIASVYDMLGCEGPTLGYFTGSEEDRKGDLFYCYGIPDNFQLTVLAMGLQIHKNRAYPAFWLPQQYECGDVKQPGPDTGSFGVLGDRSILTNDGLDL